MSKVNYRLVALDDLASIWQYVADTSQSVKIANRLVDAIHAKCQTYATQPLSGELCPDVAAEIRCFSQGSYVIYYLPISNGIDVVQVIHGSRDMPNQFRAL